jgi:hypothetical protein
VHHLGAPLAMELGWRPGDARDKHDIRRENLVALCWECHTAADAAVSEQRLRLQMECEAKLIEHCALQIGTGLVVYRRSVPDPLHPHCFTRIGKEGHAPPHLTSFPVGNCL